MYNENIDEITDILNSDKAKNALNCGHLDFPGAKALSDWNTIPFGVPSDCKEQLISFVLDKNMAHDVIARSLIHAAEHCQKLTKLIVFYVCIDNDYWNRIWPIFSPSFQKIINSQSITIKIIFSDEKENMKLCPYCGIRQVTTYKITHDTWSSNPFEDKKTPACGQCASEPQAYMT
jgi:hypothetical protein